MAVYQFKNNDYEREYFEYELKEAQADFKSSFLADALVKKNHFVLENFHAKDDSTKTQVAKELDVIRNTLSNEDFPLDQLTPATYSRDVGLRLSTFLNQYKGRFQKRVQRERTDHRESNT